MITDVLAGFLMGIITVRMLWVGIGYINTGART
jgi:hypothetical protein